MFAFSCIHTSSLNKLHLKIIKCKCCS